MASIESQGQAEFEKEMLLLKSTIDNVGGHLALDTRTRNLYAETIKAMSNDLSARARNGMMSWREAAVQANATRNAVIDASRNRSTPVGNAVAVKMKLVKKDLNQMIASKTIELFGPQAQFNRLSEHGRNRVYAEVVKSAGKQNAKIAAMLPKLTVAARGLIVISLALSLYHVATAENKAAALTREVAISAGSIMGGVAGGAAAGLACGPAAPVCVGVGAFVGGALAAFTIGANW